MNLIFYKMYLHNFNNELKTKNYLNTFKKKSFIIINSFSTHNHNTNTNANAPISLIMIFTKNIPLFLYRWLLSTNHKDISFLYFLFGAVASIAGTILSLIIRSSLNHPDSNALEHNNHLYNGAPFNKFLCPQELFLPAITLFICFTYCFHVILLT